MENDGGDVKKQRREVSNGHPCDLLLFRIISGSTKVKTKLK